MSSNNKSVKKFVESLKLATFAANFDYQHNV